MIVGKYNGLELGSIQAFRQATDDYITTWCSNNGIDEDKIHPLTWDDIISDLYLDLYSMNNKFFKTQSNQYNEYDADKVYEAFIYIFRHIHNKHNIPMKQINFIIMLGISKQSLYNISVDKLTCYTFDHDKNNLAEVIAEMCEQSYVGALEGATQHMKYLPTLNKRYGYAMQGSPMTQPKQALTTRENVVQIDGKNKPLLPPVDNSVNN